MPADLHTRNQTSESKKGLRSWGDPEDSAIMREQSIRNKRFHRLWELYDGTAFTVPADWQEYKSAYSLYRQTRLIWDHVHELVEFYATHIWSGSLARDGLTLPNGVQNAIPLAEDTDPALAGACGQLWEWWNFMQLMVDIPRYTSCLSEMLVEIIDDPESGKIMVQMIWPGYVTDVRMDEAGNLKFYGVEFTYYDRDDKKHHIYRREVDDKVFRTFRDGKPYDYIENPIPEGTEPEGHNGVFSSGYLGSSLNSESEGDAHEFPNPYGFVPAVLFRHIRLMGVRGEPAVFGSQTQLDEINALFSHTLDKTHTNLEAPILISGNVQTRRLRQAFTNMVGATKRAASSDLDEGLVDESVNILEGPQGAKIETIEIKIGEAAEILDRLIKSIERKCPEIVFYSELRSMAQLTGPSANTLLGDVTRKVHMISAGYDSDLIRLMQMAIAICGYRFSEGADGWAEKNEAQKKFAGFGLESWKKGDLALDIMPRPLVPLSDKDKMEVLQMKKNALPFIPGDVLAKEAGYDQEQAKSWVEEFDKKQEEALQKQMDNAIEIKKSAGAPPGGPGGQNTQNRRRQESQKRETRP